VAGREDIALRGGSTPYPLSDIRAIGPDVAAVLRQAGIRTTLSLLRSAKTPTQRIRIAEKIGVDDKRVRDWVTCADRMRIKGVGWEYAELLRLVGVKTVNELRYRNPARLAQAMAEANAKRKLVRVLPSEHTVARWIDDARKLPPVIRY
jgi:hypothetical protein